MKNNIYIETLKLGYENSNSGISFNQVIKKLNIDLSNISFKVNFTIWFYSNFYNKYFESKIVGQNNAINADYRIHETNIETLEKHNELISYIKGEAINKYIDYLELERTRKSSRNAVRFSYASLLIAISSIIIPIVYPHNYNPPYHWIYSNKRNDTSQSKFKDSLNTKSSKKIMSNHKTNNGTKLKSINKFKKKDKIHK